MHTLIGFRKLAFAPRLTGAAAGAGLGFMTAPEDEGATGAVVGAGAGYAAGALGDHLYRRFAGPPAAPAPVPGAPAIHTPQEMAAAHQEVDRTLNPQPQHMDPAIAAAAKRKAEMQAHLTALQNTKGKARMPVQQAALAAISPDAQKRVMVARAAKRMPRLKVGFAKLADHGLNVGVPGAGLGWSSKDERLPGMNRWVPRSTMEAAFTGLDQGLDQQAMLEQAAEAGNLAHPAIGAGLAAALAHYKLPTTGVTGKALAAFGGAGAGALYNQATREHRVDNMREAIKGVETERTGTTTAREAPPMVISARGGDD